ncbi:MAG: hypothetical protein U0228_24095 [Myxococcaceae bacterium]
MTQVTERTHAATTHGTFPLQCACGYAGQCTLKVTVEGAAVVNATREDAAVVAQRRAESGSQRAFERAALIVRCPRCGAFDAAKLSAYRSGRAGVAVFLFALAGVFAAFALRSEDLGFSRLTIFIAVMFGAVALQPIAQAIKPQPVDATFVPER